MSAQIDQLAKRIQEANEAYRNNQPIMSDAAFDALEDELRRLDANHPVLAKIGAPAPTNGAWPKAQHSIPMGSLRKCQFDAEAAKDGGDGHADLRAWWTHGEPACITHKLDGISIDLVYRNRRLVQAITRGDGTTGEDITRNVLLMEGAVKTLPDNFHVGNVSHPTPDTVYVRGEIVCRKSKFAAHFPGESNPRNTAAGTAKRQTGHEKAQYLTVVAYQLLPHGRPLYAKDHEMFCLQNIGFVTPEWHLAGTVTDVITIFESYVERLRAAADWEMDGLVVDINNRDVREAMGSHNMRPNGARALKFPHAQAKTTLQNVVWQVGKSGRITPVAEFTTVNLAGANVSRASLHTASRVTGLKLFIGCRILVSRRNDVIPMIEANLDEGIFLGDID